MGKGNFFLPLSVVNERESPSLCLSRRNVKCGLISSGAVGVYKVWFVSQSQTKFISWLGLKTARHLPGVARPANGLVVVRDEELKWEIRKVF